MRAGAAHAPAAGHTEGLRWALGTVNACRKLLMKFQTWTVSQVPCGEIIIKFNASWGS